MFSSSVDIYSRLQEINEDLSNSFRKMSSRYVMDSAVEAVGSLLLKNRDCEGKYWIDTKTFDVDELNFFESEMASNLYTANLSVYFIDNQTEEGKDDVINRMKTCDTDHYDEQTSKYIESKCSSGAVVFINKDVKKSVVYLAIHGQTSLTLHVVASIFPRIMPWYFEEKPLDNDERNLLLSFNEPTKDTFINRAFDLAERLASTNITDVISTFAKNVNTVMITTKRNEEDLLRQTIRECESRYTESMKALFECEAIIEKLKSKVESGWEQNFIDVITKNKEFCVRKRPDGSIRVYIDTYLDYYDEDSYAEVISNEYSSLNEAEYLAVGSDDEFYSQKNRTLVLDSIFGDNKKYKLKVKAMFNISSGRYKYAYDAYQRNDAIPNPHLNEYECYGDNGLILRKLVENMEYDQLLIMLLACTRNINFNDGAVIRYFVKYLFEQYVDYHILEDMEGNTISVRNAFKQLIGSTEEDSE